MAKRIRELATIEFKGRLGEAFTAYSREGGRLGRKLSFELEIAASDSRAAMKSLHGHPLLFGLDAKVKARRVAKRLSRAQELAAGMASEIEKFSRSYDKHFRE